MIYVLDAVESFSFLTHGTVWSRQMNSLSFYWVRGTCNNLIPLSLSLYSRYKGIGNRKKANKLYTSVKEVLCQEWWEKQQI